jgi:hypothetical protein
MLVAGAKSKVERKWSSAPSHDDVEKLKVCCDDAEVYVKQASTRGARYST